MVRIVAALLVLVLAACGSPVAKSVAVIPRAPAGTDSTFDADLSAVAAFRVWREIDLHGFEAIAGKPAARPEVCVLARDGDIEADLRIFVWVQVVDLPLDDFPGEPTLTWGGLVIRDRDGRDHARSVSLREGLEGPCDAFHRVAEPGEPAALDAADAFGARILGAPGEFAAKVGEILGGGA